MGKENSGTNLQNHQSRKQTLKWLRAEEQKGSRPADLLSLVRQLQFQQYLLEVHTELCTQTNLEDMAQRGFAGLSLTCGSYQRQERSSRHSNRMKLTMDGR